MLRQAAFLRVKVFDGGQLGGCTPPLKYALTGLPCSSVVLNSLIFFKCTLSREQSDLLDKSERSSMPRYQSHMKPGFIITFTLFITSTTYSRQSFTTLWANVYFLIYIIYRIQYNTKKFIYISNLESHFIKARLCPLVLSLFSF